MAKRDIVVIGSSAGGVLALKELVTSLPADFKAPIFIVQHIAAYATSLLPQILNHAGSLKAVHPSDGDSIKPGHIYLAPPDHHLLIEKDRVLVKKGAIVMRLETENGYEAESITWFRRYFWVEFSLLMKICLRSTRNP